MTVTRTPGDIMIGTGLPLRRRHAHPVDALFADPGSDVIATVTSRPEPRAVEDWDALVAATPGSDVAQLSAWARVRREAGFSPLLLHVREAGRLVAGALVLERRIPLVGYVGYVSNGPVVTGGVAGGRAVNLLLATLDKLARTRFGAFFVQPPDALPEVSSGLQARAFRPSTSEIAPAASIRVDLRRDVEELRARLSKSNRRRSRSWGERGVVVRTGRAEDLPLVAALMSRTAEHQRFQPFSADYIRTLHRELDPGGHVVVFIAELDGAPVAARVCTVCGGLVKQRLSATARDDRSRKEGVAAATVWHAMLWAKSNGHHTYDFGGIRPETARALLAHEAISDGPEAFKASFGGEPRLYPQPVELIPSPAVRLGYDLARRSVVGGRVFDAVRKTMRGGRGGRSPARRDRA